MTSHSNFGDRQALHCFPWDQSRNIPSYQSISKNDECPDFLSMTEKSQPTKSRSLRLFLKTTYIVPLIFIISLLSLWFFANLGAHYTADESHQETVVPTLLEAVDPESQTLIYALLNPLYDTFSQAEWIDLNDSPLKGQEVPQLLLDKTDIYLGLVDEQDHPSSQSLHLTWTVGRHLESGNILIKEDLDVLALFCKDTPHFLEVVTIAQAKATSVFHGHGNWHGDNSWWIHSFPSLRDEECQFRLYLRWRPGDFPVPPGSEITDQENVTYIHVASSEVINIHGAREVPTGIHLSHGDHPSTEMTLQFSTGEIPDTVPVARLREKKSKGEWIHLKGSSDTYKASDLCQAPGNETEAGKFYNPGILHTIQAKNLKPETGYVYQVGLVSRTGSTGVNASSWSLPFTFQTSPLPGDSKPFSYVVYGDQGCPHMGWKGGQKWLEAIMKRESPLAAVHHFGDISYSRGASHIWDAWLEMVQPVSTRVPLMIAIGNHEYDHTDGGQNGKDPSGVTAPDGFMPSWGNFAEDSGGECGVTMTKRFRMPEADLSSPSNGVFWYSFDHATLHTIVLSSEHDLAPGSPQHKFLEADLKQVDRSVFPWVVIEIHRPLYEAEGSGHWWPNNLVGKAMREEFEDLLVDYEVDLVLAGHYHEYQRTCDGLYKGQCNKRGPTHVTVGSAGAKLDNGHELANEWTAHYIKGEYGYGRITVENSTHLQFAFVLHSPEPDDIQVEDEFWIVRDR